MTSPILFSTTYSLTLDTTGAAALSTAIVTVGGILRWIGKSLIDRVDSIDKRSETYTVQLVGLSKEQTSSNVLILEKLKAIDDCQREIRSKVVNGGP